MFDPEMIVNKLFDDFKEPITWRQIIIVVIMLYIGYNLGVHMGENKQREAYLEREENRSKELLFEKDKSFEERTKLRNEIWALREALHICRMNQKKTSDADRK